MAVHTFNTEIAKKFGVPEAVVLWNLSYWQNKNQANNTNYHDGRYWTYNSVAAFSKIFDYLSSKQISRILLKLEKEKAIVSGCYNTMKIDRTKWYSVEIEIMNIHGLNSILPNEEKQRTKLSNAKDKIVQCNLPNGEMDFTKKENAISHIGEPIPNIKPNIKPVEKQQIEEEFSFFFSDPNFKNDFYELLQVRKLKKVPNTDRAKKLLLNKIEKLSSGNIQTAIELLEESIERGWQTVYPKKENKTIIENGKQLSRSEKLKNALNDW